jgi:c-di-GMP-binding flagellar brake protein YcgR
MAEKAMTSDPSDRRRYNRIHSENAVHLKRLDAEAEEACGKTAAMSLGGCTVLYRQPVGKGTNVELLIAVGASHKVIKARGRVVYEHPKEDRSYEVGVEFQSISPEDYDVLQGLFEPRSGS